MSVAVKDLDFAIGARESHRTVTRVAALASILARGAIRAGIVVRTEVEILVAKQSSPSVVTVALPPVTTSSMVASGVGYALVAERSLPTQSTFAFERLVAVAIRCIAALQTNSCLAVFSAPSR